MSIIAGIYSLKGDSGALARFADCIRANMTRNPDHAIDEFSDGRTHVFKVSLNAFNGAGVFTDGNGGFSLLSGETLCGVFGADADRDRDLRQIHDDLAAGKTDALKNCRGTFCAVSAQNGSLSLVADKLGIRQLFYCIGSDFIVFSTALRIIEELPFIRRKMNIRGATEQAALGYPLADRTPYENVFAMRAGEVLQFREEGTIRFKYWRWDDVNISVDSEDEMLAALYRSFSDAVGFRLQNDRATVAFLSGGLDSRCVVAALCENGARTHTFNFALPNTQDLILGARFAEKVDVIHTEVPKDAGDQIPDYSAKIADAWKRSPHRARQPVERGNVVWSGEGGSVALGHVHLGRPIAELMRAGRIDDAIDVFLQREDIHLSPKMFRSGLFEHPLALVKKGIREEIGHFRCADPARSFYLFLMLNDQRRKLHNHFENLDQHGIEFQLPFFDAGFFRTILEVPVDLCLEHRLYVNWLNMFSAAVTEVAWQSYPGHVPCPLPIESELAYQWDAAHQSEQQKALDAELKREARELLRSSDFPSEVLSRRKLKIAYLIHRTGLRDYGYLIDTARVFHRIRRKCV
ncbi:MAG: hypothetical protein IPJ30_24760 [Acidobacteria bacterium]|nr:hypothetical protein [Acidobacteriota bacterium]